MKYSLKNQNRKFNAYNPQPREPVMDVPVSLQRFRSATDVELCEILRADWDGSTEGMDGKMAFEELVFRYRDRLVRMLCLLTVSREVFSLADGIALDALWRFCKAVRTGAFELSRPIQPYLSEIARRRLLTEASIIAKQTQHIELQEHIESTALSLNGQQRNDLDIAFSGELHERVHVILPDLRPEYREVLEMRFLDGMSISEIVSVLGSTNGTVRGRLQRASAAFSSEYRRRFGSP